MTTELNVLRAALVAGQWDRTDRLAAAEAKLLRVSALADEWAEDMGILSPDSRYTRDVLVRELRAVLEDS